MVEILQEDIPRKIGIFGSADKSNFSRIACLRKTNLKDYMYNILHEETTGATIFPVDSG